VAAYLIENKHIIQANGKIAAKRRAVAIYQGKIYGVIVLLRRVTSILPPSLSTFMEPTPRTDARIDEIANVMDSSEDVIEGLQLHLREILDGAAFKGSPRSGQFLRHIVSEAIAGHFDSLKERVIGVEVFGRSPSYDTGGDSIVRVTASDVRKRLLQHYGRDRARSAYRINLPLGSYVPKITYERPDSALDFVSHVGGQKSEPTDTSYRYRAPLTAAAISSDPTPATGSSRRLPRSLLIAVTLASLTSLFVAFTLWSRSHQANNRFAFAIPWSMLLNSQHSIQLITSDPNIAEIQGFTGGQISLSDYANHNYIPHPELLTPEENRFCRVILRGDKASNVDTPIAVSIAQLAQTRFKKLNVRAARNIQLYDLQTDDNFVFLGSPRSNPWSNILNDHLDFRFEYDKTRAKEVIQNVRPHPGEQESYAATAPGWATGQSFAIVAFLQNPDQSGQALILAGENGEGTEAAGKLVTDQARLSEALRKCGISPGGAPLHFEILLRVNTLAGSPSHVESLACHTL
jgi:hypothetical protein